MRIHRYMLGVALFLQLLAPRVSAQVVVTDPATTLRNTVTAFVKDRILDTTSEQHARLRRMAQRLSMHTDLRKYVVRDPSPWRVHDLEGFLFIASLNGALSFGDAQGSAYLALTRSAGPSVALPANLPAAARRLLASELASIELSDATAVAGIHQTGLLRLNGRRYEQPAIAVLERHVIDPSQEQSATAILDKISGAVLIGARQRQARTQLLAAALEQLLVENKRTRDAEAATMTMQLAMLDAQAVGNHRHLLRGTADQLRTWRQP